MDVGQANDLFELAMRLSADVNRLRDALKWEFEARQIEEIVNEDYDLGKVARIKRVTGGYVNQSFAVSTTTSAGEHTYFMRKYNRAITEREVCFEHALVSHVNRKGFHIAAEVLENKSGGTFVTRKEMLDGERVMRFFAVYEMLGGLDKYTWVKNRCTEKECDSAARVLAQFHHFAHDFDPKDLAREQPPIMEFVCTLAGTFNGCASQAKHSSYDEYFLVKLPAILEAVEKGVCIEPELHGMPFIPVHCDYHPGNQKYVDEQVVGLFDFDWSKLDYRLFDVALALVYFCSSWEGRDTGELWLDKVGIFVRAYQDESARLGDPGPMSGAELALLPRMMANANLFVLNWDVTAYYEDKAANDDEYLMYLKHNVMVMEFIESHLDELSQIAAPAGVVGVPSGAGGGGGA